MANVDSPFGLKPVGHLLGLDWTERVRMCFCEGTTESNAIFIGDIVDLIGSSDATGQYPTITLGTVGATNPIFGVVVGFLPNQDNLSLLHRVASTDRYAMVCCDPFVIYEVQGSTDAILANTIVGANGVLIATHAGNTATGLSGMELSAATTPAAGSTYQVIILGAAPRSDNDISVVHAKWHVMITLHRLLPNYSPTDAAYFGARGV